MDTAIYEKYGLKPLEPLLETEQITMWKMTQPAINRTVLVHVLGTSMASDPSAVAYLFSVARSISNAHSPAIAQIYTIFDEPDFKAVVSEYVDGLSLEHTVSALGPLSIRQTVRTGIAIAEALKEVWDSSHIIYGSVRPEFVTLDASSTAKLVSPCYAQVAPADTEVPESDMADLGELLFFLATGVHPGQAHSVALPGEFSAFLEKLSSDSPMTRFASWDGVLEALRALESLKPAAASPSGGDGGKRVTVKRSLGAPAVKVPKVVKREGQARSAAMASRLSMEQQGHGGGSLEAARKAARERALAEEKRSSGAGAKFFAFLMLLLVLGVVFVLRTGLDEFTARSSGQGAGAGQQSAPPQSPLIAVDATPAAPEATDAPSVQPEPEGREKTPVVSQPEDPDSQLWADDAAPEPEDDDPDAALNRYLAVHVGEEVPFLYRGVEHKVTIVSYTTETVTIRTRKTFTLRRSELSAEQRALWK